jgi:photosystem II stability/assembly factor-like uncharacterized protein
MTLSVIRFTVTLLMAAALPRFGTAAESFAVFKSNNGGQSWIRSDTGMTGQSRVNAFGSANGVLFAGTDAGILISTDEALTWRPATGPAISSGRVLSFATLGRKVFAGTNGSGLLISPDGGQSWALQGALTARKVRCLLVHQGKLYAGTDAEGVFASHDDGQTWRQLPGLPAGAQVFALSATEGRVFAGLYSRGLFVWDELKRAWSKTGDVSPLVLASVEGTLVAGHNPGGLYWSRDSGVTWSKGVAATTTGPLVSLPAEGSGDLSPDAPVWELAANERWVFAGASAGIYRSADYGRTWTRARNGLPAESPGIAFLAKSEFILAATWHKGSGGEQKGAASGR